MATAAFVTIYAPGSDKGEKHTIPNARDLVAHSRWTYKQGRTYEPTDSAPYASRTSASALPVKAQEVLDSVGSGQGGKLKAEDDPVPVIADDDRIEVEFAEVVPPVVAPDEAEPEAAAPPPAAEAVAAPAPTPAAEAAPAVAAPTTKKFGQKGSA